MKGISCTHCGLLGPLSRPTHASKTEIIWLWATGPGNKSGLSNKLIQQSTNGVN